jgi:hypothetical protein
MIKRMQHGLLFCCECASGEHQHDSSHPTWDDIRGSTPWACWHWCISPLIPLVPVCRTALVALLLVAGSTLLEQPMFFPLVIHGLWCWCYILQCQGGLSAPSPPTPAPPIHLIPCDPRPVQQHLWWAVRTGWITLRSSPPEVLDVLHCALQPISAV